MKSLAILLLQGVYSIKLIPLRFLEIIGQFFPENTFGCRIRGYLLKPFLKKCGKNFQVALNVKLEHLKNISVGDDVYIGYGSWISGLRGGIILEDEVMIGPYLKMVSSNHTFCKGSARFAPGEGKEIKIGFGTWVASGVTITAGVVVEKSCLVAAGSVVTKSFEKDSIIAGVPAKKIGNVSEKYKNVQIINS